MRYPNARLVHVTYGSSGSTDDVLGRVAAIKDDSGGSPGTSFADYSYLGGGTIVAEDYAQPDVKLNYDSGTAGEYAGFDRFGRVVDHLWYDYGASADRDRFAYGYDRASSRLYRENTVASGKDEYYSYDDVNRLTVFDRGDLNANKDAISGTPVKEEDWGLDMTGNWSDFLQKTSGSTDLNQDRTHNPVNEITGITETVGTAWVDPVHDKAGNMTTLPKPSSLATGLTCKWDAWNRLVEVKEGATVVGRYEYDGLGRRAKSHVDSQSPANPNGIDAYVHCFYNQGWQDVESRVSGSENTEPESLQPLYQYVWSRRYIDAPVLRDKNTDADGLCDDERLYYLGDANFNVTTLVNTGGDAVERYVYSPYGVLTIYDATWSNTRSASSYANVYTYTGRQLDTETGLFYYRARMYSAQLGRFCSRDPIGYQSGFSLLQYVDGDPITGLDPTGEACIVYYNCKLIGERGSSWFIKECIYACTESKKARKDLPGVGKVDCKEPKIPVHFTLYEPVVRGCSCASTLDEHANMWDDWGGFFDCDRDECIQQAKDAASKAKAECNFLPPGPKQACKAFWTAWEQGMISLCAKCTGKKDKTE